jgi:hypothetical protein
MPVLAIFTGEMSEQQYEELRAEVGWEQQQPEGGILHVAAFNQTGTEIHIADVWESSELMTAFVTGRLAPALAKLGIQQPEVELYPTHNINAYASIEEHRL